MPRRPVRRFAAAPRRKRSWARNVGNSNIATSAGTTPAAIDLLGTWKVTAGSFHVGLTVARIRLQMVASKAAGTGTGLAEWGVLAGPATLDAADMDPSANPHLDWMGYGGIAIPAAVGTLVLYTGQDGVDIKSMRKLDELDMTLWFVLNTNLTSNTMSVNVQSSCLLLLP